MKRVMKYSVSLKLRHVEECVINLLFDLHIIDAPRYRRMMYGACRRDLRRTGRLIKES